MKKVLIAVIGGAAAAFASLAQAADLPSYKGGPSYYDNPPAFTWTGFYVGGNAALGFGGFSRPGATYFGSSPFGGAFGLTLGYNYQSGNLLVGAEGDYAWSHIADENNSVAAGFAGTGVINNIDTIRARVGYVYNRAVFYGTGGYAGADVRGALNASAPPAGFDQIRYVNGFTLGAGIEYAITPHITAKAEYLYASFGSAGYFGAPYATKTSADLNLLRGGVNYKF